MTLITNNRIKERKEVLTQPINNLRTIKKLKEELIWLKCKFKKLKIKMPKGAFYT